MCDDHCVHVQEAAPEHGPLSLASLTLKDSQQEEGKERELPSPWHIAGGWLSPFESLLALHNWACVNCQYPVLSYAGAVLDLVVGAAVVGAYSCCRDLQLL